MVRVRHEPVHHALVWAVTSCVSFPPVTFLRAEDSELSVRCGRWAIGRSTGLARF